MCQRRFAPTVTTGITPTLAHPMDSMAQIILLAAFSSARGRGSMVSAAGASLIATISGAVVDSGAIVIFVAIVDSEAIVDSVVIVDSMATRDFAVIAYFMAIVASTAVASSTAVTDFTAAEVEDSMAEVAVPMVAVASTEATEVTAVAVVNRG